MKITGSLSGKTLIFGSTSFVYLPFLSSLIDDPIRRKTHA